MLATYLPKPKEIIYVKCFANISFVVVNTNSNSYGNDPDGEQVISGNNCIKNLTFKLHFLRLDLFISSPYFKLALGFPECCVLYVHLCVSHM